MREIRYRLAIDHCAIPLAQDLEILRSFVKLLPRPPAAALQKVRSGSQRIRRTMNQVGAAVAIIVHGKLEIIRRQKLGLPELAGVSALHLIQRQVAALENLQRGQKLALKQ